MKKQESSQEKILTAKGLERRVKQHCYAKPRRFFAVVQPGFEQTARREMEELHFGENINVMEGGIEFDALAQQMWMLHLRVRGLTRIMVRLDIFRALFWDHLHEKAARISWELYIDSCADLDISITCRHSKLYHTGRIEQEIRSAIEERFKETGLIRNRSEKKNAKIFVRFEDDVCTISLDATGDPLYRRGYKTHINEAPIRETLASLILQEADCCGYDVILDPMCGSGTFPIEAAIMSGGLLPGTMRHFAFEQWPGFSEKSYAFQSRKASEDALSGKKECRIFASDIDKKSLDAAAVNIAQSGAGETITLEKKNFFDTVRSDYPQGRMLLVMNPPYGGRLHRGANILDFYRRLGEKVRNDYSDCGWAIIVPGEEAEHAAALPFDRKIPFMNGGIRVALLLKQAEN